MLDWEHFKAYRPSFEYYLCVPAQLCQTVCGPTDCPPGSSVHGIFQARRLEWVAISFSRGPFWPTNSGRFLPRCRHVDSNRWVDALSSVYTPRSCRCWGNPDKGAERCPQSSWRLSHCSPSSSVSGLCCGTKRGCLHFVNRNIGCPVKFAFQIHNQQLCSINLSQVITGVLYFIWHP